MANSTKTGVDESDKCAQGLIENFYHYVTYWRDNTVEHKQSWKFLKCIDKNFQTQVTEQTKRRDAVLELVRAEGLSTGM